MESLKKFSHTNPYAFNEYGVLMAASILNSKTAIEINRTIIKVFVELRKEVFLKTDFIALKELIKRIEAEQETIKLNQKLEGKIQNDKITQLSREVHRFSKILDEFQDTHTVLRKSDIIQGNSSELN